MIKSETRIIGQGPSDAAVGTTQKTIRGHAD